MPRLASVDGAVQAQESGGDVSGHRTRHCRRHSVAGFRCDRLIHTTKEMTVIAMTRWLKWSEEVGSGMRS